MNVDQIVFVIACLLLPILWGVIVHRLFEFVERRLKQDRRPNDGNYPDFQI